MSTSTSGESAIAYLSRIQQTVRGWHQTATTPGHRAMLDPACRVLHRLFLAVYPPSQRSEGMRLVNLGLATFDPNEDLHQLAKRQHELPEWAWLFNSGWSRHWIDAHTIATTTHGAARCALFVSTGLFGPTLSLSDGGRGYRIGITPPTDTHGVRFTHSDPAADPLEQLYGQAMAAGIVEDARAYLGTDIDFTESLETTRSTLQVRLSSDVALDGHALRTRRGDIALQFTPAVAQGLTRTTLTGPFTDWHRHERSSSGDREVHYQSAGDSALTMLLAVIATEARRVNATHARVSIQPLSADEVDAEKPRPRFAISFYAGSTPPRQEQPPLFSLAEMR